MAKGFAKFKAYCAAVMRIRRNEILIERKLIDITTWPIEELNNDASDPESFTPEEVTAVASPRECPEGGGIALNPFNNFNLETVMHDNTSSLMSSMSEHESDVTRVITLSNLSPAKPVDRPEASFIDLMQ